CRVQFECNGGWLGLGPRAGLVRSHLLVVRPVNIWDDEGSRTSWDACVLALSCVRLVLVNYKIGNCSPVRKDEVGSCSLASFVIRLSGSSEPHCFVGGSAKLLAFKCSEPDLAH
ncbi:hypothetical protein E2986_14037, partial [Frieseomelitta varia]